VPCADRRFTSPALPKIRITIITTSWIISGQLPWEVISGQGIISRSSAGDATGSRPPGIWEESHDGRNIIAGDWLTGAIPGRSCFSGRILQNDGSVFPPPWRMYPLTPQSGVRQSFSYPSSLITLISRRQPSCTTRHEFPFPPAGCERTFRQVIGRLPVHHSSTRA
jgi:hypothetical protein